jgi:hypothetical protein
MIVSPHGERQANLFLVVRASNTLRLGFGLGSAGRRNAARMAMMAMTTRSSIRVKPLRDPKLFLKIMITVARWSMDAGPRPTCSCEFRDIRLA